MAQQLTNSVSAFSSTQGAGGWFYGYYVASGDLDGYQTSDFQQMTQFVDASPLSPGFADTWYVQNGTFWTNLYAQGGHGNGTVTSGGRTPIEQWSVRRYVSPVTGLLNLSGEILKLNTSPLSNGIIARIYAAGGLVYNNPLNGTDGTGFIYNFNTFITAGSFIDFVIDPRSSNDGADDTRFTATISVAAPEPSSLALISVCGLSLLRKRKCVHHMVRS